jgi:glycosyltransferase involved in cell wall biosynthesis
MSSKPLVSIVIPVYNGENFVREAIDSALSQTYENIEIVVVNDGSTDGGKTKDACMEYEGRIKYFEKENGGCASAINYGIKKAEGDFISWLSHDDLYYPDKIKYQVGLYESKGLDSKTVVISNQSDLIDQNGKKIFHPSYTSCGLLKPRKAFSYLLFGKCFNGCGLLIPKDLFKDNLFFNEGMKFVLDWNLWLRFAIAGASFFVDKKVLVSNRRHSMQVTQTQKELHKKEAEQTVEELFDYLKDNSSKTAFLKYIYYFAYSTNRKCTDEIEKYLKKKKIKINFIKKYFLKLKIKAVRFLKCIYHKLR